MGLNTEIERYRKQYEEDSKLLKEITSNKEALEKVAAENCPENYGFNAIPLRVPEPGTKVELQFEGVNGKQGGYVLQAYN